jgi:hypothetical protein
MTTRAVAVGEHRIEIATSLWSGAERVLYDGRVVSEKRSFFYLTPHVFQVEEEGQAVVYEIDVLTPSLGLSYGYIVRRNGIAVACKP